MELKPCEHLVTPSRLALGDATLNHVEASLSTRAIYVRI